MPLLSIITINFNDSNGLENSIKSLADQDFKDVEYIIIDGGSSDGSVEVIKKYEKIVDHWRSEPDKGVYDAMNKGLKFVTADYVYFLNSGDIFHDNKVLSEINKLLQENLPDILYGNVMDVDSVTGKMELRRRTVLDKIELFNKMVCHQALVSKTTLFNNNFFDTSYKIKADYNWLLKAFTTNTLKVLTTDVIIANYLMGGLSDVQYTTYSVKEIPQIRNAYFTKAEQNALRRYIFHPKLKSLPFGQHIRQLIKRFLQLKNHNLN